MFILILPGIHWGAWNIYHFLGSKKYILADIACRIYTEPKKHGKLFCVHCDTHSSSLSPQNDFVCLWSLDGTVPSDVLWFRAPLMYEVSLSTVYPSWSPTERNPQLCLGCGVAAPVHSRGVLECSHTSVIRLRNASLPVCVLARKISVTVTRLFFTKDHDLCFLFVRRPAVVRPLNKVTCCNCVSSLILCYWHLQLFLQTTAWTKQKWMSKHFVCHSSAPVFYFLILRTWV